MRCKEIHGHLEGCEQEIANPEWEYCPTCGSPTAHLVMPDGVFPVESAHESQKTLLLRARGFRTLRVAISLQADVPGFKLAHSQAHILQLDPRTQAPVRFVLPPVQTYTELGQLNIEVNDAPLTDLDDPWQDRSAKTRAESIPI